MIKYAHRYELHGGAALRVGRIANNCQRTTAVHFFNPLQRVAQNCDGCSSAALKSAEPALRWEETVHFVSALHGTDVIDKNYVRRLIGQMQADKDAHYVIDGLYVSVAELSAKNEHLVWRRRA